MGSKYSILSRILSQRGDMAELVGGSLSSAPVLAPLVMKAMGGNAKVTHPSPLASSSAEIDVEREEIMLRLNWLCKNIITNPQSLRYSYPDLLGDYYGPQWVIYSAMMLVAALSNVTRIWPDTREESLKRMEKLIELLLSEELREYDTRDWGEDALDSLMGNKSHITYLSILAWSISLYRLAGGDARHDNLFSNLIEAINRRFLTHRNMILLSFPNRPPFFPDMMLAIVALKNFGQLVDDRYQTTVEMWLDKCQSEWIDRHGLIFSMIKRGRLGAVRGSYTALNTYWMSLIEPEFAFDQYERMKRLLLQREPYVGIREWIRKAPHIAFDPDSGPVLFGLSPSGTAFAIGAATAMGDWTSRREMLLTAEALGGDVRDSTTRHYRLAEFALVGEATVLAMRTTLPELIPRLTE